MTTVEQRARYLASVVMLALFEIETREAGVKALLDLLALLREMERDHRVQK